MLSYKFQFDDKGKVIVPKEHLAELQDFLEAAYQKALVDKTWLLIYNQSAELYNRNAGKEIYSAFETQRLLAYNNENYLNSIQMATAKKAATKGATQTKTAASKKDAAPKAAATKAADKKAATKAASGEKPISQKEDIIALAAKGKTINEIVELRGYIKANVAWYFSKFKLHAPKPKK